MSEDTTPQEVEANDAPPKSPEAIDDLLNEYKEARQPAAPVAPPAGDDAAALAARLAAIETSLAQDKTESLLSRALSVLRDEHPELKRLPDLALRGAIRERAEMDPRFATAFFTAPQAKWRKIVAGIGSDLLPEKELDPAVTADRAAMRASLSGTGTKPPEEKSIADQVWAMSPAEFRKLRGL